MVFVPTTLKVNETAAQGYLVGEVKADDPDSGSSGEVRYAIQRGNEGGQFALDAATGRLTLRQALDFEAQSQYL